MNSSIEGSSAKHLVKSICTNYKVPYISLSPLNRYCVDHGHQDTDSLSCPVCGKPLQLFQRITGYLRQVDNFNEGKKEEFYDRRQIKNSEV
jgi:ribonucleoside-triphosphate reductase